MAHRCAVLGSSGAVGSQVLVNLLASPSFSQVVALVRRPSNRETLAHQEKLVEHVINMNELSQTRNLLEGCDVAISTLGVGQPSKSTAEEIRRVELEYVNEFAKVCKSVGVRHFSNLGSTGVSKESWIPLLRLKQEIEDTISLHGFERTSFFRPSFLITEEARYGVTDSVYLWLVPKVSWLFPSQHHEISVKDLGKAFVLNIDKPNPPKGVEVLHYDDFMKLLNTEKHQEKTN